MPLFEAARAGEAGMGFAVVAEEVRNLAQRSAEAAKNTATLIAQSQDNANNGVVVSEEVGNILKEIAVSVQKVTQLIAEVSSASDEQSQGISQVSSAVSQMDQVTQSNAASAEESASASEELSSQATELNEMVNELNMLIGGANGNTAKHTLAGKSKVSFNTGDRRRAKGTKLIPPMTTKENRTMKPNDVIPLADEEFEEF